MFELTWQQFRNLNHIRILNESEQIRQYNFYLDGLSNQIHQQNKGQKPIEIIGFLLQENLFLIQQEDGSGIYITGRYA